MARPNARKFTILAQDPEVRLGGRLVFATVDIPNEDLGPGPTGYRVRVIDFDASADVLYAPWQPDDGVDRFAPPATSDEATYLAWERDVLGDPRFHAQNSYAIAMSILARFEFALGRRVAWGFEGHQLHIAPHAFIEPNAFYSEHDKALMFGYFDSARFGRRVFTCLSHDIVAHETTHAILDGLRDGFTYPSTPDQAAFHEGFSDVVALLSMFSLREVVELSLTQAGAVETTHEGIRLIRASLVSRKAILASMLLGLGKEFGKGLDEEGARADSLRRSVNIEPSLDLLDSPAYAEAHARGEIFAAAMLRSFVAMWRRRIAALGRFGRRYNLDMVIDEGAEAARNLLTMAIRALDYCPPVDLDFRAYLSALLTADAELVPDDGRYGYRDLVRGTFAAYGVLPAGQRTVTATGYWREFDRQDDIVYTRNNADGMLRDKDEVFRFIWENRRVLAIDERGYIRVSAVRTSMRQDQDGFFVREMVCEYIQVAQMYASELRSQLGIDRPVGMPPTQRITAYGGGTLIFDQYGRLKYHVEHRLNDSERQSRRLQYLWEHGLLDVASDARSRFAEMHELRCRRD